MTTIKTETESYTITLEDGKEVYPCRCGDTHRGDYAIYDYGHHNCFHDAPLVDIGSDIGFPDVMCRLCGEMWRVEGKV